MQFLWATARCGSLLGAFPGSRLQTDFSRASRGTWGRTGFKTRATTRRLAAPWTGTVRSCARPPPSRGQARSRVARPNFRASTSLRDIQMTTQLQSSRTLKVVATARGSCLLVLGCTSCLVHLLRAQVTRSLGATHLGVALGGFLFESAYREASLTWSWSAQRTWTST